MTTIKSSRLSRPGTADECFEAMRRHARRDGGNVAALATVRSGSIAPGPLGGGAGPPGSGTRPQPEEMEGDILYGAKAIARYLFGDDGNRSRRRVFNLWAHYQHRKERAGFIKLKGAVCLSKSQWRAFHGLG